MGWKSKQEGKEGKSVEVVNTLTRLDFFGESSLVQTKENPIRDATITCVSKELEVAWLTKEAMDELLENHDITDSAVETALETREKRRASNLQAKRRSLGTLEFSGGSNKTNTASEAGCNSGGSEEAGDDDEQRSGDGG